MSSSRIDFETIKFEGIDEFIKVNNNSKDFEYTVSWIDTFPKDKSGKAIVKGIFIRGNHSVIGGLKAHTRKIAISVPFKLPNFFLNSFTMKVFNFTYFHRQLKKIKKKTIEYDSFFFPLDSVRNWNRIYGKRGFYQYQIVLPVNEESVLQELLDIIAKSGLGSFLTVLKLFGDMRSPGALSFPVPGFTLALDFPNTGKKVLDLFKTLNQLVLKAGGKVYPAKDMNMSAAEFQQYYKNLDFFRQFKDPKFESQFSRRVQL